MVPENKLELTSLTDLAREEKRISKKKALEFFESGTQASLAPGTFASLKPFISTYLGRSMTSLVSSAPSTLPRIVSVLPRRST